MTDDCKTLILMKFPINEKSMNNILFKNYLTLTCLPEVAK